MVRVILMLILRSKKKGEEDQAGGLWLELRCCSVQDFMCINRMLLGIILQEFLQKSDPGYFLFQNYIWCSFKFRISIIIFINFSIRYQYPTITQHIIIAGCLYLLEVGLIGTPTFSSLVITPPAQDSQRMTMTIQ